MNTPQVYRALIPVIVWAGAIFMLSHTPNLESGLEQDFLLRKIGHIIMFAVLALLTARALIHIAPTRVDALIGAMWLATAYAWADEVHQLYVVGRVGSLKDVAINFSGIVLGLCCWYVIQLRFSRTRQGSVGRSSQEPSDPA